MSESTTTVSRSLKIGNQEFNSVEEYSEAVIAKLPKSKNMMISPEAIYGFNEGGKPDFSAYAKLGFHHPKDHNYYNLKLNENGDPALDSDGNHLSDPRLVEIYEGIRNSGELDDPLVVYRLSRGDDSCILVLDGATRLTCVSHIIAHNPEAFRRIPVVNFSGTEREAIALMTRRNLEGRQRPLSDYELCQVISRWRKAGWTKEEMCEALGKDSVKFQAILNDFITAGKSLIADLRKAWRDNQLSRSAAFNAAKATEEEQEAVAQKIAEGEKVTGSSIRRKNAGTRSMNPTKRIANITEKFIGEELTAFLKTKRKFSAVEDHVDAAVEALNALSDAIDAELNPQSDEPNED